MDGRLKYFFSFLFVINACVSFSQQKKIDSLHQILVSLHDDTNKIKALNKLGDLLDDAGRLDSSLACESTAIKLAEKLEYKKGLVVGYMVMGYAYEDKGDYTMAFQSQEKMLAISKSIGSKVNVALAMGNIGVLYYEQGNYREALEYDSNAISISEEIGDKVGVARNTQNIGLLYKNQGNYTKALEYFFKATTAYGKMHDSNGIANNWGSMANVYENLGNYVSALDYDFKSLAAHQLVGNKFGVLANLSNIGSVYQQQGNATKALEYFLKALAIDQELHNQKSTATILGNIGGIYYKQQNYAKALMYEFQSLNMCREMDDKEGIASKYVVMGAIYESQASNYKPDTRNDESRSNIFNGIKIKDSLYKKAQEYYFQALAIEHEIGDKEDLALTLNNIGKVYIAQKNYKQAKPFIDSSLSLSKSISEKKLIMDGYESLYKFDSLTENYKSAFHDHQQYIIYRDSMSNLENVKKITKIELVNELKTKQDSLKEVQDRADIIKTDESTRKSIIADSAVLIAILILILAYVLINQERVKRQKDKITFSRNLVIAEQEKSLLKMENQSIENELNIAKKYLDEYIKNVLGKNELLEQYKTDIEYLRNLKSKEIDEKRIEHLESLHKSTILTEEDWDKFKNLFEQAHKGFFTRLKEKLADLTQAEIRMVCLTKLKLDTRQMAGILAVSDATIRQSRYRLRKKLGLTESDDIDDIVEAI